MNQHLPTPEEKKSLYGWLIGQGPMPDCLADQTASARSKKPAPKKPAWNTRDTFQCPSAVQTDCVIRVLTDPEKTLPILEAAGVPVCTLVDMQGKTWIQGVLVPDDVVTFYIRGRDAWEAAKLAMRERGLHAQSFFRRAEIPLPH